VCGFGGCLFLRKWWTAFVDMMEARGVLRFDMLGGRTLTERFAGIAVTWLRLWTSFCWIDPNGRPTARDSVSGPLDPAP
jgi:hypothetical protein